MQFAVFVIAAAQSRRFLCSFPEGVKALLIGPKWTQITETHAGSKYVSHRFAVNGWWTWPGSNRRPPACKAGALPAELHAPRFLQPTDQYTSCRNFSNAPTLLFPWNIWNNFLGQNETIAHALRFGEPSRNVFLQR